MGGGGHGARPAPTSAATEIAGEQEAAQTATARNGRAWSFPPGKIARRVQSRVGAVRRCHAAFTRRRAPPTRRRRREPPQLLGRHELRPELPVGLERAQLRPVAVEGGALARVVGVVGGDRHRRRPDPPPEELGHPPGQHPGDVLVARVLVAEPRRLGVALAHEQPGLVGGGVIGVGEPERQQHRRRCAARAAPPRAGRRWPRARPTRAGAGTGARRNRASAASRPSSASAAASSSRRRASTSSPGPNPARVSQCVIGSGYASGAPGVDRDDGDARVRGHEPAAPQHGVVEVGRDDHHRIQLARGRAAPTPASPAPRRPSLGAWHSPSVVGTGPVRTLRGCRPGPLA